jgi:hypothetical protein
MEIKGERYFGKMRKVGWSKFGEEEIGCGYGKGYSDEIKCGRHSESRLILAPIKSSFSRLRIGMSANFIYKPLAITPFVLSSICHSLTHL